MFGKNKTMKGVVASYTADAKAVAAANQKIAAEKRAEIAAAQVELDAAVAEIQCADAFIAGIAAMACPAGAKPEAVAVEVK